MEVSLEVALLTWAVSFQGKSTSLWCKSPAQPLAG